MKITSKANIARFLPTRYIERSIHKKLLTHLDQEEATVLYGPRQVGKSIEVYKLIERLCTQKSIPDIYYFSFDLMSDDFSDPNRFIRSIHAQNVHADRTTYICIDEAQRLKNAGLFLKYIYDQKLKWKLIVTGSASLEIKEKIKEPLTGRKQEFFLAPMTLSEYLFFHHIFPAKVSGAFAELEELLTEYMRFGGYPGVVLLSSDEAKIQKLTEIADSYITKDLVDLFTIKNTQSVRLIASFFAQSIGNLVSREAVSRLAGVSAYETEKIIDALEKLFVVWYMRPYGKTVSKELIHRPKVYFWDIGIRNAIIRRFDSLLLHTDTGQLFENSIANLLVSQVGKDQVRFWRTNNQTEVDFIVDARNGVDIWEAKYSWDRQGLPKNMMSFKNRYKAAVQSAHVVSKNSLSTILSYEQEKTI